MSEKREATTSPRPKLSDIGRLDNACPNCGEQLARRPERKIVCPHCGNVIFVRTRPLDRQRVLLTPSQATKIEAEWTASQIWARRGRRQTE